MSVDFPVFKDKTLSDILEEVHNKASDNRTLILDIIKDLRKLCGDKNPGDAAVFYPIIKEYLIALVASDSNLVKIATIVQRIVSADSYANKGSSTGLNFDSILSESERNQIIENSKKELMSAIDELENQISPPLLEDN